MKEKAPHHCHSTGKTRCTVPALVATDDTSGPIYMEELWDDGDKILSAAIA